MKPKSGITLIAATSVLALSPVLGAATAQENAAKAGNDVVAQTTASAIDQTAHVLRTSNDLYRGLRDVRAARLAIFNGDTEQAGQTTADALKDFEAARMQAPNLAVSTSMSGDADEDYLPFDMTITLAEGFQPTDEKLANIAIVFNTALIPINTAISHLGDASDLMAKGSYYEANLALKAIEDGVVLESCGIDGVPSQGSNG